MLRTWCWCWEMVGSGLRRGWPEIAVMSTGDAVAEDLRGAFLDEH